MKAMPTKLNGYLFRSRAEARWSIFLDKLEIKYQYEPEVLGDGSKNYLPDFWLPYLHIYFEVKGQEPNLEEKNLARLLAASSEFPVIIGFGDVEVGTIKQPLYAAYLDYKGELCETDSALWAVCNHCKKPDVFISETDPHHLCLHDGHNPQDVTLINASRLARSARFTRGQEYTYRRRFA